MADDRMLLVQGVRWPDPRAARDLAEQVRTQRGIPPGDQVMLGEIAAAYDRLVGLRGDACFWAKQIADGAEGAEYGS